MAKFVRLATREHGSAFGISILLASEREEGCIPQMAAYPNTPRLAGEGTHHALSIRSNPSAKKRFEHDRHGGHVYRRDTLKILKELHQCVDR